MSGAHPDIVGVGTPSPRDGGAGRAGERGILNPNGPPLPGPLLPPREEKE